MCVVDANGKVVKETKVESHPDALVALFNDLRHPMARIGLEAGPLSQWLHAGLTQPGFETVLLKTRHVKAALSAMTVKTDRKDPTSALPATTQFAFRLAELPVLCTSFWLQLEAPFTAALTVAILAEPTRGQALEKAGYRLIATIIGVAAPFAIVGVSDFSDIGRRQQILVKPLIVTGALDPHVPRSQAIAQCGKDGSFVAASVRLAALEHKLFPIAGLERHRCVGWVSRCPL